MCPPNWQYVSLKDKPTDIKRVPVATNASAKPNSFVPRVVVPRSSFHRLFLLRVLRPDRIGAALTQFVQAGMGGHAMTCHIMPTWIYEASLKLLVPVTLAHTSDARAGKDWWCYIIESRERERYDNTWMFDEQSVQKSHQERFFLLRELIWTVTFPAFKGQSRIIWVRSSSSNCPSTWCRPTKRPPVWRRYSSCSSQAAQWSKAGSRSDEWFPSDETDETGVVSVCISICMCMFVLVTLLVNRCDKQPSSPSTYWLLVRPSN